MWEHTKVGRGKLRHFQVRWGETPQAPRLLVNHHRHQKTTSWPLQFLLVLTACADLGSLTRCLLYVRFTLPSPARDVNASASDVIWSTWHPAECVFPNPVSSFLFSLRFELKTQNMLFFATILGRSDKHVRLRLAFWQSVLVQAFFRLFFFFSLAATAKAGNAGAKPNLVFSFVRCFGLLSFHCPPPPPFFFSSFNIYFGLGSRRRCLYQHTAETFDENNELHQRHTQVPFDGASTGLAEMSRFSPAVRNKSATSSLLLK